MHLSGTFFPINPIKKSCRIWDFL